MQNSFKANPISMIIIICFSITLLALCFSPCAGAQDYNSKYVPGEIIIKLKLSPQIQKKLNEFEEKQKNNRSRSLKKHLPLLGIQSIDDLNSKFKVTSMQRVFKTVKQPDVNGIIRREGVKRKVPDLSAIYLLKISKNFSVEDVVREYQSDPNVEYAEPNYLFYPDGIMDTTPNDPYFPDQWGLKKIEAEKAWDVETGSDSVIIGIIDTGIDWDHPDLEANIWVNPGEDLNHNGLVDESDFNGIDDDVNGYVDDIRGWDFVSVDSSQVAEGEDASPRDNDPMDFLGHGTSVAGIAGAVTNNNEGIAGVTWKSKLMPVRAGFKSKYGRGVFRSDDIAAAIFYAADNGADIINMSFSSYSESKTEKLAIDYADSLGCILIASAGNNNSSYQVYPASYDNVLAVAATDNNDMKTSISNYGEWINVCAPGVDIRTTYFDNNYTYFSGTSAAAPFVSGLAGLILSQHYEWTNDEVIGQIITTTDDIDSLNINYKEKLGSGRINALRAISTSGKPYIVMLSWDITDTLAYGNHKLTPGKSTGLIIKLKNWGWSASNVVCTLSTNSNSIVIHNPMISFDLIETGQITDNLHNPFDITVSSNVPLGEQINFTIKIEVENKYFYENSFETTILTPDQPGWPQIINSAMLSSPVIADIDGDGDKEIAIGSLYYADVCIWHHDGKSLEGWNRFSGGHPYAGVLSSPAIADIDHDGDVEIIYGHDFGYISAKHHTGAFVNGWPVHTGYYYNILSSPAVADFDNDGFLEIIIGQPQQHTYALNFDGTFVEGFPLNVGTHWGSPAIADLDSDGIPEIITSGTSDFHKDTKIYAFHIDGSPVKGWPVETKSGALSSPVVGDLDNDGNLEVIVATFASPSEIYVWHSDGVLVDGWPIETDQSYSSPAIGDIDGDGDLEIIHSPWSNSVYAWHHDGSIVNGWPFLINGCSGSRSQPAIGDIDSDNKIEIIVATYNKGIFVLDNQGNIKKGWPITVGFTIQYTSPALADVDDDGDIEIVIGAGWYNEPNEGGVFIWDCPGKYDPEKIEWGMYQHDPWHTGNYHFQVPEPIFSIKYEFMETGWYLISIPIFLDDYNLQALFNNATKAFTWNNQMRQYTAVTELDSINGFWLSISSTESKRLIGDPLESYSKQYKAGWQLIGSLGETVSTSAISTNPPNSVLGVFGWDVLNQKYKEVTQLVPGQGYWLALARDCQVTVSVANQYKSLAKVVTNNLTDSFINSYGDTPPLPPIDSDKKSLLPKQYALLQNYPNPFNPETIIKYQLPEPSHVKLEIYNMLGQKVITLVDSKQTAGFYHLRWNGVNASGNKVSTGIYFCKLQTQKFHAIKKMIFIR